jgi:hypothetical protein
MGRLSFALIVSLVCVFLLFGGGCESPAPAVPPQPTDPNAPDIPMCAFYCPARIAVLPLTGFVSADSAQQPSKLHIYVSLLDAFGRQIKYPAEFRFEVYEYVQFVGDHKGNRLAIWPDLDLEDPQANDYYWQDYLRAYRFEFEFEPTAASYMLEVTCICGYGKRLSAHFELK